MAEFNNGDMVYLKSGSPKMTIEHIGKYGMGSTHDQAKCVWFEGSKRMEAVFELHTLRAAGEAVGTIRMERG
jgi:uncharacterized protein YodC (DUF2158 family)